MTSALNKVSIYLMLFTAPPSPVWAGRPDKTADLFESHSEEMQPFIDEMRRAFSKPLEEKSSRPPGGVQTTTGFSSVLR